MSDLFRVTGVTPLPGSTAQPPPSLNVYPVPVRQPVDKMSPALSSSSRLLTFLVRPAALLSVLLTEYRTCRSNHAASRGSGAANQASTGPAAVPTVPDLPLPVPPGAIRDVFISYSSKDHQVADMLCATLEANRIRCWIAPRDLVPGSDWSESIIAAIVHCRVMVLVLSAGSNHSIHVKREVERAAFHRKIVIPIRTEPMRPSPSLEYFISLNHWFDASTPPLAPHFARLAATIRGLCDGAPANDAVQPSGSVKGAVGLAPVPEETVSPCSGMA
jgi:hypothetical protein